VFIRHITLQNFRCFATLDIPFQSRCVLIQGNNGAGKSSILEALHYSCYLRSFRTHVHRDLLRLNEDHFFIKITTEAHDLSSCDVMSVGFSPAQGKLVKFNDKPVHSYKDHIDHYRMVTLSADDLQLVNGAPEVRRDFLNYALFLQSPGFLAVFKRYRQILEQRNSILFSLRHSSGLSSNEELRIWTKSLWEQSNIIRVIRCDYLQNLEVTVNKLLAEYFVTTDQDLSVSLSYHDKVAYTEQNFESFWQMYKQKHIMSEQQHGRSLFGVHLDDFSIIFQQKKARVFASRGQQKLIVFLIKVAQMLDLNHLGEPGVLLLDDFLTDFDDHRVAQCLTALYGLPFQIIVTCPTNASALTTGLAFSAREEDFSIVSL